MKNSLINIDMSLWTKCEISKSSVTIKQTKLFLEEFVLLCCNAVNTSRMIRNYPLNEEEFDLELQFVDDEEKECNDEKDNNKKRIEISIKYSNNPNIQLLSRTITLQSNEIIELIFDSGRTRIFKCQRLKEAENISNSLSKFK